jgi:hypothetical protein
MWNRKQGARRRAKPRIRRPAVWRRPDILESERREGRITEPAYLIGRIVEHALSRERGWPQTTWPVSERINAGNNSEMAMLRRIDRAKRMVAYSQRVELAIGVGDALLIRAVLGEGKTYALIASTNDTNAARIREWFCGALERLTDAWAARGQRHLRAGCQKT